MIDILIQLLIKNLTALKLTPAEVFNKRNITYGDMILIILFLKHACKGTTPVRQTLRWEAMQQSRG